MKTILVCLLCLSSLCAVEPKSIVDEWLHSEEHVVVRTLHRELALVPKWDEEKKGEAIKLVEMAGEGKLDHWKSNAKGYLALSILLNQYPRALWPSSTQAYALDEGAERLVIEGIELQFDRDLSPTERLIFYLPLIQSEDVSRLKVAIEKLRSLAATPSDGKEAVFEEQLEMALFRLSLVERFGRLPQRNEPLGRHSSDEEIQAMHQSPIKH